ncbi:hypothetical protein [Candidatus Mycolicibacterium alkanivorans]|uniref:Uncharacterized protein n=1 Tax=Candidatus Mycolicibacterium alkanivorans TaxID=2954114 RepID=A0ABS9YVT0_9MYCO|nr:hypothetical protein [Candidatus Mycolicibacterium alkanivorans]MCI4674992.1 hypothetical protein [Candidatus Mycolicibacterium alkanivorans]
MAQFERLADGKDIDPDYPLRHMQRDFGRETLKRIVAGRLQHRRFAPT